MLCQCPKCETIFRLGREQLDVADGLVACSICEYEFDAYDILVPEPGDRKAPAHPVEAETLVAAPGQAQTFDDTPIDDEVPIIIIDDEEDNDMSVLYSASIEEQIQQAKASHVSEEPLATLITIPEIEPDDTSMIAEPEEPEVAAPEPTLQGEQAAAMDEPEADAGLDLTEQMDLPEPKHGPDKPEPPAPRRKEGLPEQLETELMSAKLHQAAIATHRTRRLLWNTGTVLLILALGMQYIYVIRNELAQSAESRPWAERYCKLVGCELPLRRDVQSIELLQREITQDLERDDVLHVRAMFVNQAGFTQSWPIVQVTLSDTSNQVIAMRRLKPAEYLIDEPVKQGMLPGKQVIIDLRFLKPEKPVSTYEFDFL